MLCFAMLWKTSFEKKLFFCVGEYTEYGFDQQSWYGMFVSCGIWCLADASSVSPSSEQTEGFLQNPSVCSDEELTLEASAKHHIPQATNIRELNK